MVPVGLNPDGHMNVEDIGADLTWFEQEGLLGRPLALDVVLDHSYLTAALAVLGPYRRRD